MTSSQDVYEVGLRKDHRGVDLMSDVPPFGRLWYDGPNAVTTEVLPVPVKWIAGVRRRPGQPHGATAAGTRSF
jgi:hypothetical protein